MTSGAAVTSGAAGPVVDAKLAGKLVIGITSRALFDLDEANAVFERDRIDAYREFQRQREHVVLRPGTAYPLVRRLLALDGRVEVVIFSRNDADSAMRVFHSIKEHGLPITRGVFRNGRDPWPFLPVFGCHLFLSVEETQVLKARELNIPAARVMAPPTSRDDDDDPEVRIALDGDAVLFDAESQKIMDAGGLDAFERHEVANADVPMSPGPFWPFLEALAYLRQQYPTNESPIRTALVTARAAPAHLRIVNTFRHYGLSVDETYFLGGVSKTRVLEAFGAHIFFDDDRRHVDGAASSIPSAHVPWPAVPDAFATGATRAARDIAVPATPPRQSRRPSQRAADGGSGTAKKALQTR